APSPRAHSLNAFADRHREPLDQAQRQALARLAVRARVQATARLAAGAPFAELSGDRILACPIGAQRLPDEQAQRRQRRVHALPIGSDFLLDCSAQSRLRQYRTHRLRRLVTELAPKARNRLAQAFFWYLHSWLILSC